MSKGNAAKVTVSLPDNLVDYATAKAERLGISRSQVIANALAEQQAREQEELAGQGYRFYAEEAQAFAEASLPATSEALDEVPPHREVDKGRGEVPSQPRTEKGRGEVPPHREVDKGRGDAR